jgi:hypothetical protein
MLSATWGVSESSRLSKMVLTLLYVEESQTHRLQLPALLTTMGGAETTCLSWLTL